ncbi:MAG TPA: CPBP family intramembrane glutamic endopeptidase [Gemmatimonadaceae bacterium]|nr:CPBP family intramembrane glutamic endopeptidase [Gemmatimonadaceae bacterium]
MAICLVALLAASLLVASLESVASMFGLRVIVHPLVEPLGFLAAHAVMLNKLDRREWSYVWLHRGAARVPVLAMGIAVGTLALAVPVTAMLLASLLSVADSPDGSWWITAWLSAGVLLPAAFAEELFARGYLFALLREAAGWKWAITVTSVAFGLLHLANPGANWQSLSVVVLAGFFLGAIVLVTGSLYAATLAHFVWNWIMAAVLHMPVSGLGVAGSPDYRVVETGPDWLTGGSWGPEGGLAAAFGLGIGLAYLYWSGTRRNRV